MTHSSLYQQVGDLHYITDLETSKFHNQPMQQLPMKMKLISWVKKMTQQIDTNVLEYLSL